MWVKKLAHECEIQLALWNIDSLMGKLGELIDTILILRLEEGLKE